MVAVTIPARPQEPPHLRVDTVRLRTFADHVLAASSTIDDLGSFCNGAARVGDWEGRDASAYHAAVRSQGPKADAMSLGLRKAAQAVDAHADHMGALTRSRDDLLDRRLYLEREIADLERRVDEASSHEDGAPAEVDELRAHCARVQGWVDGYDADVRTWRAAVSAEELTIVSTLTTLADLDQVLTTFGGVTDPGDAALDRLPDDGSPRAHRTWWDGLTDEEQLALVAAHPDRIGNLDGLPAWARSEANETSLYADIAAWDERQRTGSLTDDEAELLAGARAARDALAATRGKVDPVTGEALVAQLHTYDPTAFSGDGRIAVSVGDLDTATNLSVSVPGLTSNSTSVGENVGSVTNLYEAGRSLHPGQTLACLAWIGYDAPDASESGGVAFETMATNGGDRLADTLDGLRASRDDRAHLTVIGHSYGSTTVGHGLSDHDVEIDDAVVVGSPGLGGNADDTSELDVPEGHVFVGANSDDPVADLGDRGWADKGLALGAGLGNDPSEGGFGATRFQAEDEGRSRNDRVDLPQVLGPVDVVEVLSHLNGVEMHTSYYDHDSESLYNMSQIVTGHQEQIMTADHIYDPWYAAPRDPEADAHIDRPDTNPGS